MIIQIENCLVRMSLGRLCYW